MELRPLIERLRLIAGNTPDHSPAQKGNRLRLLIASVALLAVVQAGANAATAPGPERIAQVKAAFVLNIARFVSWPKETMQNPTQPFLLCLYRENPLSQAIETIQGEEIAGHRIEINRIQSLTESGSCQILLIAHQELENYATEANTGINRPMLTIADLTDTPAPTTIRHGILVTLVRNGARIGFKINLDKSRQAGLRMSSELLKLAIIVGDDDDDDR